MSADGGLGGVDGDHEGATEKATDSPAVKTGQEKGRARGRDSSPDNVSRSGEPSDPKVSGDKAKDLCSRVSAAQVGVTPSAEETFMKNNPLWTELMRGMRCSIDHHIIRILDINGFRTYQALKEIEDSDVSEMQDFVKSGGLVDRVLPEDMHYYLGSVKDLHKFRFMPGEKKLIKSIVNYVKTNHKEENKPLGKLNIYPIFQSDSNKRRKIDEGGSSSACVVSTDMNDEISSIKNIVKLYLEKKNFPQLFKDVLSNLNLSVKTVEKEGGDASLTSLFECSFCKKKLTAGYRERNSTWVTSNLNRHLNYHKDRKDSLPGTVNASFFQATPSATRERESRGTDSDLEDMFETPAEDSTQNSGNEDVVIVTENPAETTVSSEADLSSPSGNNNSTSVSQAWSRRVSSTKRALGKHGKGQTRICVYFPILNEVQITLENNKEMIEILKARCEELSIDAKSDDHGFSVSNLLNLLMKSAAKNARAENHGQRYDKDLKLFSAYLFLVGGRFLYETLQANLKKILPSITEVERTIHKNAKPVIEGAFRFQELKDFLLANKLPLKVVISEDGTRIQEKFMYDPATNQIVGPVLPLSENGVPLRQRYPATSAAMIASHLKNGQPATIGYAIMAQPLQKGAPSFCLALFGTDNRFTAEQAFKRSIYIHGELLNIGVESIIHSADGDPKMLAFMHSQMFGPGKIPKDWEDWFFASLGQDFTVIQDPIHAANKYRSRFNRSVFLVIGKYPISTTHVRQVIKLQDKEKHGLNMMDLEKEDKMNFNSSFKLCTEKVTNLLKETVPGSDGTVAYLTNMRFTIEAFLDESLSPNERVYKIAHAVFFFRYWKIWLTNHKDYTIHNFVTANLYMCIEILFHALILLIMKFRDNGTPELLLVALFGSQACESFFRLARSMTSTQHTVINFCMKEFLAKVKRVDFLQFISSTISDKLEFPRDKRKAVLGFLTKEKLQTSYLPTDGEISEIVLTAQKDVLKCMKSLGVSGNPSLAKIKTYVLNCKHYEDEDEEENNFDARYQADINEEDIPLDILAAFPSPDDIPSLDPLAVNADQLLPATSIFVSVPKSSGSGFVCMKKSTLCWLLISNDSKLSNDRLQRVRQAVCYNVAGHLFPKSAMDLASPQSEVEIGDWCIFKRTSKNYVVQVLGFSYLTGSGSARSYTLSKAPTKPPSGVKKVRGIGCLCTWFRYSSLGKLSELKFNVQFFVDMDQYVATIPPPSCSDSLLQISQSTLSFLRKL